MAVLHACHTNSPSIWEQEVHVAAGSDNLLQPVAANNIHYWKDNFILPPDFDFLVQNLK